MRAAEDNPEDARLRQAELEAARTGRERLMGARERAYVSTVGSDLPVDLDGASRQDSTRAPSRDGASAAAALPRQTCRVHGCWRPQTSGHLVCSMHLQEGVTT